MPDESWKVPRRVRASFVALVHSISFSNAPIPTKLTLSANALRVWLDVRDRQDGSQIRVRLGFYLPAQFPPREVAIEWIYACVQHAWVHELEECFFVDGARRRDMHDERGNTKSPPNDLVAGRPYRERVLLDALTPGWDHFEKSAKLRALL